MDAWHDLFVMSGGAAAALAGLIFVAVSVNVTQVLEHRSIPLLAARTLVALVALVILCVLALAPGQPDRRLGVEVLVLAVLLTAVVVGTTVRGTAGASFGDSLDDYIVAAVSCLPMLIGGAWLSAELAGGYYWLMAEIVAGLVATTYNAWVLLIEIRR